MFQTPAGLVFLFPCSIILAKTILYFCWYDQSDKKMVLLTDIAILFKSSRVRSCRSFRKKVYIWISSNICNYEFNVNKLLLLGLQGEISPLETSVLGCRREAQGETNLFVPRGSGEVQYCTVPSSKVLAEQGDLQLKQKLMFG